MGFFDTLRDAPRSAGQFGRRTVAGAVGLAQKGLHRLGFDPTSVVMRLLEQFKAVVNASLQRNSLEAREALREAKIAKKYALQAQREAAGGKVGKPTAASRLRSRGATNMRVGPVSLTKSGIRMQTGGLRGFGDKAFTAGMAINIVGGLFNQGADIGDAVAKLKEKGATNGEMVRAAGGAAARAGVNMFGIENLGKGMLRLGGMSEKDANKMMEEKMDRIFLTEEELGRKRKAKRDAIQHAREEVDKIISQDMEKIGKYEPRTFRVRSKQDMRKYHAEMKSVNRLLEKVKGDVLFNRAKRAATGN